MTLLTFALPTLVRDENHPVAISLFPSQQQQQQQHMPDSSATSDGKHILSNLCTMVELAPVGLAFQRRVELMWAMQAEEELRERASHVLPDNSTPLSSKKLAGGASRDVLDTLLERAALSDAFVLPIHRYDEHDNDEDEDNAEEARNRVGQGARQQTTAKHKRFLKMSDEELLVDWYDMLRLPQGEGASQEQIRTAYRRRCLETHPDKQRDKSDAMFKKVQRAFEILDDVETRLSYDSSRPFDDEIPSEVVVRLSKEDTTEEASSDANTNNNNSNAKDENVISPEEFYRLFGPVFERNKRWSVERDLPSLGDDDTPHDSVMQFYHRWNAFKSWRDFAHLVELAEIDESMCREEKRYYARENERQLGSHRRAELKRVRTLVERAQRADPRLLRRRLALEEQRAKEKADREAFRQKMREESEQQRLAELARMREGQEQAQRSKQQSRQQMRESAQALVDWLRGHDLLDETPTNKLMPTVVRRPNIQWLFAKLTTPAEAAEVVRVVCAAEAAKRPATDHTVEVPDKKQQQQQQQQQHNKQHQQHKHGTHDSVSQHGSAEECADGWVVPAVQEFNRLLLEREALVGLTRYGEPVKRGVCGAGCSASTATQASHQVGRSSASSSTAAQTASTPLAVVWTEDDLLRLRKATMKYPPGAVERWSKISAALRDKFTAEQAMAKVAEITAGLQRKDHLQQPQPQQTAASQSHDSASSALTTSVDADHNDAASAAGTAGGDGVTATTNSARVGATVESTGVKSAGNGVVSMGGVPIMVPGLDEWTMKQQKQLEQGLRELKDYKEKDKFQKLAKLVEGKTAKECFDRFRYLCTLNKRK